MFMLNTHVMTSVYLSLANGDMSSQVFYWSPVESKATGAAV